MLRSLVFAIFLMLLPLCSYANNSCQQATCTSLDGFSDTSCTNPSKWVISYYKPSLSGCSSVNCGGDTPVTEYHIRIHCDGSTSEVATGICACPSNVPTGKRILYTGPTYQVVEPTACTTGPGNSPYCLPCCQGLASFPKGMELCNNGIDDDNDGRVDENCGPPRSCNTAAKGKPVFLQNGNMTLKHSDFSIQSGGVFLDFSRTYNSSWYSHNISTQITAPSEDKYSIMTAGWRHSYQSWLHERKRAGIKLLSVDISVGGEQGVSFKPKETSDSSTNPPTTVTTYIPQLGSGGYKLEKTSVDWILSTPQGSKLYYPLTGTSTKPVGRARRIELRDESYLDIEYKSVNGKNVVDKIKPFLKGGLPLSVALYFAYVQIGTTSPRWFLSHIVIGKHSQPKVCSSNSDCANDGGSCSNSTNSSGVCGFGRAKFEYISSSVPNASNILAHNLSKVYHDPTQPTKDFILYEYNNMGLLTSAKDAESRIFETHTYDSSGRAITSNGSDGDLQFSFNPSNNQATITDSGGLGYSETVTYDPDTSNITSQSGSCNCSNSIENQWIKQHGYVLASYNKYQGNLVQTVPYRTYSYSFSKVNDSLTDSPMYLSSEAVTIGDNDTNHQNTPPYNSYTVKTYYHPKHPALITAKESPSFAPQQSRIVIYDYDATPFCSSNVLTSCLQSCSDTTCILSKFNKSPTSQVHRIIVRGYTKTIGGSWQVAIRVVEHTYDQQGRLSKTIGPRVGQETKLSYYSGSETNPFNNYQLKSVEVRVESSNSPGTSYYLKKEFQHYNAFGQPTQILDPNNVPTSYIFDNLGRLLVQKINLGSSGIVSHGYAYDNGGLLKERTNPNGSISLYTYNNYRMLETVSFKESSTASEHTLSRYTYNTMRKLIKVEELQLKDHQSNIRETNYSHTFINSPGNIYNNGVQISVTPPIPESGTRTLVYDGEKRLRESIDGNQQKVTLDYDDLRMWLVRVNYQKSVGTGSPFTTNYERFPSGHIKSIEDGNHIKTSYEWDDFGHLIKRVSPDRAPSGTEFEYDASGNLSKYKRADGTIVNLYYDTINRLVRVDYPDPALTGSLKNLIADNDVRLYYDGYGAYTKGRLTKVSVQMMKDSSSATGYWELTTKYKYDDIGRITQEEIYEGSSTAPRWTNTYTYNLNSQRTSIIYPYSNWLKLNYNYNSMGQLSSISQDMNPNPSSFIAKFAYTPALKVLDRVVLDFYSSSSDPSQTSSYATIMRGLYQGNLFNGSLHTSASISTPLMSGNNVTSNFEGHIGLIHRLYEYTHNGQIKGYSCQSTLTSLNHCYPGNKSKMYEYNGIYQLTKAGELVSGSTPRFFYAYDFNGNLKQMQDHSLNGDTWILDYFPGTNRLKQRYKQTSPTAIQAYSYDSKGRRTEDHYWEYIYDGLGRIALISPKVSNPQGKYLFFVYDHLGRRYVKYTFTSTNLSDPNNKMEGTVYLYDSENRLLEEIHTKYYGNFATKLNVWGWAGTKPMFSYHEEVDDNGLHFNNWMSHHNDHLGRPAVSVDALGIPTWRSTARPFGYDKGISLRNKSWENGGAWEEKTLPTPIEANNQTAQLDIPDVLKPGVYAVQFYFEDLTLNTGQDYLFVSQQDSSGIYYNTIHSYTGSYTPQSASGFWSNVISVDIQSIKSSPSVPNGTLRFDFIPAWASSHKGFKITKVRYWYVRSGLGGSDLKGTTQDRHPTSTSDTYLPGPGWTASKTWTSPTYSYANAGMVRMCFSNFDVENHYDYVNIVDENNQVVEVLTGNLGTNYCTSWVAGASVKAELFVDNTVQFYGLQISHIEVQRPYQQAARLPGQWYEKDTEVYDVSGNVLSFGLHYNWNRYYDPNVGLYLTPDTLGMFAGMNPYIYALSNPINFIDWNGLAPSDNQGLWQKLLKSRWMSSQSRLDSIGEFFTGMADSASWGIGSLARGRLGLSINTCSTSYFVGGIASLFWGGFSATGVHLRNSYKAYKFWKARKYESLLIPVSRIDGGKAQLLPNGRIEILRSLKGADRSHAIRHEVNHLMTSRPHWGRLSHRPWSARGQLFHHVDEWLYHHFPYYRFVDEFTNTMRTFPDIIEGMVNGLSQAPVLTSVHVALTKGGKGGYFLHNFKSCSCRNR